MTKYTIVAGQSVGDHVALTISSTSDFSNLIVASGPGQTDQERSLEEENARLRTELTHAKEMALAAAAETAMVRNSLKLVLNEHDKECTELERTIARQVVLIHEQARMIATAAEQASKSPEPVNAIEHADWTPPAGLPRGMR